MLQNLIFTALTLVTPLAHAQSGFEFELANSATLLAESKSYEAKHINQDLTVSIQMPKFSNPTGEGALFLSISSDLNGVCQLFGLKTYVANSKINFDATSGRNVIIDASSKFGRFGSNSYEYAIGTITCDTGENKPIPVSDNLSARLVNDDESVTLKTPKFMMNGQNMYISSNSDLNGVCKLYGLKTYVPNSKINLDVTSGKSVNVNAASKFRDFDLIAVGYVIGSLICR
jgi:hypothetical protein